MARDGRQDVPDALVGLIEATHGFTPTELMRVAVTLQTLQPPRGEQPRAVGLALPHKGRAMAVALFLWDSQAMEWHFHGLPVHDMPGSPGDVDGDLEDTQTLLEGLAARD